MVAEKCVPCELGWFNDKKGSNPNTCKLCPSGKTTSASDRSSCSVGKFVIGQHIRQV